MRVLISGAGIAGPTLAWFLAKAGADVTIVEKAPSLLAQGQNVDITGSAIKVLRKMGLLDEVRRFNTTEQGTQFIDSNGLPFAAFPVQKGATKSFTSEYEILRGDLAQILFEASKTCTNVTYMFETTINKVVSNDDNAIKVELSNGQTKEYDVLVAADGQWSKLRKQCFAPEDVTIIDKGMYAIYWTIPRISSDNNWWNVYLALQSRTISLRPDPHNTTRATLSCMPSIDEEKKAWIEAAKSDKTVQEQFLRKVFAGAGWQEERLFDTMAEASDFYFHAIQQIRMSKWSQSRVVCLGDTAYAPSPLTGMGTSLAISGAYVLAGELSKLDEQQHPSVAFEAYEQAFRPFVEQTQKIPPWVPSIAHPATAWKRWLLQSLIVVMSKVAAVSWITNRFAQPNEEDFVFLPYPRLDV